MSTIKSKFPGGLERVAYVEVDGDQYVNENFKGDSDELTVMKLGDAADRAKYNTDINEAIQELVSFCWENAELIRDFTMIMLKCGKVKY